VEARKGGVCHHEKEKMSKYVIIFDEAGNRETVKEKVY